MPDLRSALEDAGYDDVRTLLQSGNVVVTSNTGGEKLERRLSERLLDVFGLDIPVLVRTRDELADVIEADPLSGAAENPSHYQVSFLSAELTRERVEELEDAATPPERLAVHGREVYAYHPDGIARSDLAKLLSARKLGVEVTARNWRTLTKLLQLAGG